MAGGREGQSPGLSGCFAPSRPLAPKSRQDRKAKSHNLRPSRFRIYLAHASSRLKATLGSAAQVILGPDPQLALYGEAAVWFHKVELFRQEEEQRLYRQSPSTEDLSLHRQLLLRLVADGEHLARLIEQHGFLTNGEGIAAEDLKATLRNLRADYRGWHEPMPGPQQAQILREVFDVSEPSH